MKWQLVGGVAVLAAISLGGIWYFSAEKQTVSCKDLVPRPTIVAFGDSLIEGHGAATKGGFVTMLSKAAGVPIENLGVGGNTSAQGKARLSEVTNKKPDIAIMLLGGNDALRGVSVETTRQNLDDILSTFTKSGTKVVLLGVVGGIPFRDPYPEMYEDLADKYDVPYVSNVLSGLIGKQEYMSDSVHPNEAGYERITNRVLPALEEACGKLKP
jgi:acyl-CoA thioesterase I